MADCVFCRIIEGRSKADIVYEDDDIIVIRDLFPQAPVHLLAITREHIPSADKVENFDIWAKLMNGVTIIARNLELHKQGYRLVVNCGRQACQSVDHLHVHILAGRQFRWPPG